MHGWERREEGMSADERNCWLLPQPHVVQSLHQVARTITIRGHNVPSVLAATPLWHKCAWKGCATHFLQSSLDVIGHHGRCFPYLIP